jgi:hypothetical protein
LTIVSQILLYKIIYTFIPLQILYCGMLKTGLLVAFCVISSVITYAQQGDFCDAVTAIIHDAPEQFRNLKGKRGNQGVASWESGVKIPGTIASRFISSMGLFYEGGLFQAKTMDGLKEAYEKYKTKLGACLTPLGYVTSYQPNFAPGLNELKKVVFMRELTENTTANNAPAHVTLEALYSKQTGLYTVVMFIFEH